MILVICPLKLELKHLKQAFLNAKYKLTTKPSHCVVEDSPFTLAIGGHGKVNFALSTFELIKKLKPDLVICAGAAGGLKGSKELEVIAATETIEHDYIQKIKTSQELPFFKGSKQYLEKVIGATKGIIASGDEDVTTLKRAKEIQEKTKALCVAWEGAGGGKACLKTNTPFLEVRFISDMCNENTEVDFYNNILIGMNKIFKIILSLS